MNRVGAALDGAGFQGRSHGQIRYPVSARPRFSLILPVMAREIEGRTLMIRYRDGDVVAFETLYTRHKGPLYRFFLRHGMGTEAASELMQEVWMKIIRAKDDYEPTAKFTTYLYRLAHHCLIDRTRRSGHKMAQKKAETDVDINALPASDRASPEADAIRNESVQRFREALNELPDEQREAFILKQEAGLSLADIAYVTGVSTETAKSRLRYAFEKLRQRLFRDEVCS